MTVEDECLPVTSLKTEEVSEEKKKHFVGAKRAILEQGSDFAFFQLLTIPVSKVYLRCRVLTECGECC